MDLSYLKENTCKFRKRITVLRFPKATQRASATLCFPDHDILTYIKKTINLETRSLLVKQKKCMKI